VSDDKLSFGGHCQAAVKAAVLFGALAGFVEGIVVLIRFSKEDFFAPLYGAVLYALLSIPIGVAAGVAGWIVLRGVLRFRNRLKMFLFYGMLVFAIWVGVVSRYWMVRDVFHEKVPAPLLIALAFLAGGALVGLILGVVYFKVSARIRILGAIERTLGAVLGFLGMLAAGIIIASVLPAVGSHPAGNETGSEMQVVSKRPSVILIVVDALRADRLPCYGYDKVQAPAINAFSRDAVLFERAFSQASWTRASFATIYTSLYPSTHNTKYKSSSLPDSVITIAEALKAAGYVTAGFADNIHVTPEFNFQQGFDEYTYLAPDYFFYATASASELAMYKQLRVIRERFAVRKKKVGHYYQDAKVVTDHALSWLDRQGEKPFFLMLHYMDTHDPYFEHPYNGRGYARVANPRPAPEMAPKYSATYDREIEYLDTHLDRLFRFLKRKGYYDRMVIVLTSDHGEEFYDHSGWWHGQTLYREVVHVPLIVKLPGEERAGERRSDLARSLDIAPTIADLLGVDPPVIWQGKSLFDASTPPTRFVFFEQDLEGNVLEGGMDSRYKIVLANPANPRGLPPVEIFDVKSDSLELNNLYGTETGERLFPSLAERLERIEKYAQAFSFAEQKAKVSEEVKERMRVLGYTE